MLSNGLNGLTKVLLASIMPIFRISRSIMTYITYQPTTEFQYILEQEYGSNKTYMNLNCILFCPAELWLRKTFNIGHTINITSEQKILL